MNNRSLELDVNVLLPAISKATAFEKLLSQRFTGVTLTPSFGDRKKLTPSNDGNPFGSGGNPFSGLITVCFENYLNIYVEAQDRSFAKMIEQFVEEQRKSTNTNDTSSSPNQKAEILPTSGKLFTQYKNCLIQCISLSNRMPLVLLSNTFQKYLREYAHKILQAHIPRVSSGGSGSGVLSLGAISSTISSSAAGLSAASSSAAGLLQIFMKDLENKAYSVGEIVQLCAIILTANYCLETTVQLEKKIQEKIDSSLAEKISMSAECDIFHA